MFLSISSLSHRQPTCNAQCDVIPGGSAPRVAEGVTARIVQAPQSIVAPALPQERTVLAVPARNSYNGSHVLLRCADDGNDIEWVVWSPAAAQSRVKRK
jgi:hypothetical protein